MPQPTFNDLRPVDPVMTQLSIGYKNSDFFWDVIAPPIKLTQQSGTYFKWTKDYWFRKMEGGERAPAGPYQMVHFGVDTDTYRTREYGFEDAVDESIRAASQTAEDLDVQSTKFLVNIMQYQLEKDAKDALWKTGVWGTDITLSGNTQWDDYTNSDPFGAINTAMRTVKRNTGMKPNSFAISGAVWDVVKEHPKIIEKYKYTQKGIMTEDLVAAALGIPNFYVLESVENTAKEGLAFAGADIWDQNGLLWTRMPNLGLMVPNTAYHIIWDEKGNFPWAMQNYNREEVRSKIHRIFTHKTIKVVAADRAYYFNDMI